MQQERSGRSDGAPAMEQLAVEQLAAPVRTAGAAPARQELPSEQLWRAAIRAALDAAALAAELRRELRGEPRSELRGEPRPTSSGAPDADGAGRAVRDACDACDPHPAVDLAPRARPEPAFAGQHELPPTI